MKQGTGIACSVTVRLWLWEQRLIYLACARVPWPLSEAQRQRFGIENEWCTPEMAARLRAKLGLNPGTVDAAEH